MGTRKEMLAWGLGIALLAGGSVSLGWAAPNPQESQEKPKETETQKTKAKKSKSSGRESSQPVDTRKVLSRLLRSFKDGFEGLSPSSLRGTVDDKKFYDFPRFEDGVTELLRSVGEMRLFTREVSVEVKEDRAVMIIEAEMVFSSREDPDRRTTRKERVTFDFQRTPEGWKITEINPRTFFLPTTG